MTKRFMPMPAYRILLPSQVGAVDKTQPGSPLKGVRVDQWAIYPEFREEGEDARI